MRPRPLLGILAFFLLAGNDLPAQQLTPAEAELDGLRKKAEALRLQGKNDEAIAAFRAAVTHAGRAYGSGGDLRVVPLLQRLAGLYLASERYNEAEFVLKRALAIRLEKLPADHTDLAASLDDLGRFYRGRGQFEDAAALHKKSLAIFESRNEPLGIGRSLGWLAGLHSAQGDFARAEPLARRSVQVLEKERQRNPLALARALNNLASVYKNRGDHRRAEELVETALRLRQETLDEESPLLAEIFNNLGELAQLGGRLDEAEAHYRRALAIEKKRLGAGHLKYGQTLGNLGLLFLARGELAEAETLLDASLKILRDQLGPEHSGVAQGLNNLAQLRKAMGQLKQAEELYRESLRIRRSRLGPLHPDTAGSLNNLANLYMAGDRLADAEPLYRACLQIQEARLGKNHLATAQTANNLGVLETTLGHLDEAEELLRRAWQIRKAQLGEMHPDTARALNGLAVLARARGRHDQAEQLYRRSLAGLQAALPPDHPHGAQTQGNLALLYAAGARWPEAADVMDRARRSVRRHIQRVLPGLSEREQLLFLQTQYQSSLHAALSLGLAKPQDQPLAALSAAWVLNGKGVAQQALAERALLARDSEGQSAAAAKQLAAVRTQLATVSLQSPAPGQETAHRQLLARLTAQEQQLAKHLGRAPGRRDQTDPWVELDDVRRALPADGVLIEVVRVRPHDVGNGASAAARQAERYVAWIIPPAGSMPVQVIDLGPVAPIDAAVRAVRQQLRNAPQAIRAGEEEASERRLRQALAEAAALVVRPLEGPAGGARRWLLSLDGSLWLLPWAALPLRDGAFALQKHSISYLVSGRDLLVEPAQEKLGPPLILADPDFDWKPAGTPAGSRRGTTASRRLGPLPRLPGTASEAAAVAPLLKAYTGVAPRVFLNENAQESIVKKARSPRALVLATHGFFLEEPAGDAVQNPLVRCGLLLAGSNHPSQPGQEDGILTGLEIVGCDLRGTELVVLSACETALGEVHGGEGVAGLRQAFQLAGARCVAATLWQIPDRETVLLMTAFFDGLARGQAKADALRAAQLKLLEGGTAHGGHSHPYYWAAFTLTGE